MAMDSGLGYVCELRERSPGDGGGFFVFCLPPLNAGGLETVRSSVALPGAESLVDLRRKRAKADVAGEIALPDRVMSEMSRVMAGSRSAAEILRAGAPAHAYVGNTAMPRPASTIASAVVIKDTS
jgi:hypothetical protein